MSFRSDVHRALDEVTPPARHLPHTVMQAVREGRAPRRSRVLPRAAVVLAVVLSLAVIGGGVAMFFASSREQAPSRPGAAPRASLVVTTWTQDPSASYPETPYPGYRPVISPITSSMVTQASAMQGPRGDWIVHVSFNAQGNEIFRNVTAQAAAACPQQSDCRQGHVTMWLDLTQDDVEHWNQRAHDLYRPFNEGGKLLTDPGVVGGPIVNGAVIAGDGAPSAPRAHPGFSQQQAEDLAHRLNP